MFNISFILFLILAVTYIGQCQFNESKIKIIDHNQGHFLIRGNLPIDNSTFCFDKLYNMLSQLTNTTGYRLVVVNLLNLLTARETKHKYISQNYFNEDGQFVYNNTHHLYQGHPIVGSMTNPVHFPRFVRKLIIEFYDYFSIDQIPALVTSIEQRMNSPKKTIIYIYSYQGMDRIGYVSGAYLMKAKGISFRQVMKINLQFLIGIRSSMNYRSYNGLQWYCLYLKRNQQQCQIQNTVKMIHLFNEDPSKNNNQHQSQNKKSANK